MQKTINLLVYFALIAIIVYGYTQLQKYKSLSETLLETTQNKKEQKPTKEIKKIDNDKFQEKINALEKENKQLKEQIFQLEKQEYLFNSNKTPSKEYKLEENLKFKDETKELKKEINESDELKDDDYKISPSIDFNRDTKTIDGVKLEVETKF